MPDEPSLTPWNFPDPTSADRDLIAIGADLQPGTILRGYRRGFFPMPIEGGEVGWWSPERRGVLPLGGSSMAGLRVTRSLRRSCRTFEIRVNTAFDEVIDACADPARDGFWIEDHVRSSYVDLHRLGWAHSVEAWRGETLVGGLYGVAIGGLFAGESMFHRERDASKVALVGLVELLEDGVEGRLLDVQWRTDHLATLGVIEVPRVDYLARLRRALELPLPAAFS